MSSDSAKAETVLNMLKENSAEIQKKNTELAEKTAELEKKDKIIDLMSEQLAGLTIWKIWNNEKEEPLILGDKKEVKQYFEKLAKEKGETRCI